MSVPASIRQRDGKLEIINQLLLPHESEYIEISSISEAHDAIKTMKVSSHHVLADNPASGVTADQRSTGNSVSGVPSFL